MTGLRVTTEPREWDGLRLVDTPVAFYEGPNGWVCEIAGLGMSKAFRGKPLDVLRAWLRECGFTVTEIK
jgi:hypothetical protein